MTLIDPSDQGALRAADAPALTRAARAWSDLGLRPQSMTIYEALLERQSDDVEALRAVASAAVDLGDIDKADRLYRRMRRLNCLSPDDFHNWFDALMIDPPRPIQASNVVAQTLAAFPFDVAVHARAALQYSRLHDLASALAILMDLKNAASSSSPGDASSPEAAPARHADVQSGAGITDLSESVALDILGAIGEVLAGNNEWSQRPASALGWLEPLIWNLPSACLEAGYQAAVVGAEDHSFRYLRRWDTLVDGMRTTSTGEITGKYLLARLSAARDDPPLAIRLYRELLALEQSDERWLALDPEWRVYLSGALYEDGQLSEAETIATEVLSRLTGAEPGADAETQQLWIEGEFFLAQIAYDSGRFADYWAAIKRLSDLVEHPDMQAVYRAALSSFRAQVDVSKAWDQVEAMRALRSPDPWADQDGRLIELRYLAALAWAADHTDSGPSRADQRQRDKVRIRDAARFAPESKAEPFQRAYLALLADENDLAWRVLERENDLDSWRRIDLHARAALRTGRTVDAYKLYADLLGKTGHRLSTRCGYVEAALETDRIDLAIAETKALLKFAPDHVHAHILMGDCYRKLDLKNRARSKAVGDRIAAVDQRAGVRPAARREAPPESPLALIEATHQYAKAIRLHDGLRKLLNGDTGAQNVGSDLMSNAALQYVARKGAFAAIRARRLLERTRTHPDREFLRDARSVIRQLQSFDRQEASQLRKMFDRPRGEWRWLTWVKRSFPFVAGALVLAIVLIEAFTSWLKPVGVDVQVLVLGLLGLAVLWPFVLKFSVGTFGFERLQTQAPALDDGEILGSELIDERNFLSGQAAVLEPPLRLEPPQSDEPTAQSTPEQRMGATFGKSGVDNLSRPS